MSGCERCEGSGMVTYPQPHPDDAWADVREPCPACNL